MTPQERALKVAMQWQACTDPTNLRVLALMGLVQIAIEAAVGDAVELARGEHMSDRNRFQNVLVNLHAIARDVGCEPSASIGMATSAVRELRTERDRLRAHLESCGDCFECAAESGVPVSDKKRT